MIIGMVQFLFFIVGSILSLLIFAILASAILSWLFAFDVINYRNRFVVQIAEFLDRLTSPFLSPLRRIIPSLGGIDLSPLVAILVIQGIQRFLLPPAYASAMALVGAY